MGFPHTPFREFSTNRRKRPKFTHFQGFQPRFPRSRSLSGTLGRQSLSDTVSYALELARSQEKNHARENNGTSTPSPARQEPAEAERFELPDDLTERLRETAEKEGFSESGILEHALRFLMDEIEAGRRAWTRRLLNLEST